ncbi:MAG: hypothetical protein Q8O10_04980, partial [candidate division Zixibacteria bacterium]|nr:hypothetical protein [candidate division Zixibacteria bacterium]
VAGGQSAISAESDNYHTIVAKSNNSSYYSIYGYKNLGGTVIYARANVSTGSGGTAINGYAAGTGGNGVIGECNNGSSAYGIWGISSTGFAGWFDGKVWINGNFTATGTKSSVIQTSQGTKALYAIEGLDVEFYASGSSSLNNGYAQIVFENLFQEAISAEIPIKVIVTPTADCNGIFVENKSHSGFSVKEIMSGTSNASFDWIAIGRRKGYEIRPEVNIQNQEKRMIKELGE